MTNRINNTVIFNIIFLALFFYVNNAFSAVTCNRDTFGNTHCYGTDGYGNRVDTTSHTDSFGNTNYNFR